MLNCLFCGGAEDSPPSKEHLLSQPVADAFGINRDDFLASIDARDLNGPDLKIAWTVRMSQLQVHLPCRVCNQTWMNELEHRMAPVARWVRAEDNAISAQTYDSLRRWLLKTYIVLTALEGGARRFGTSDNFHMIPEATRGRQLWQGDEAALDYASFGFAKSRRAGTLSYFFGNPTVIPSGPRYANVRSAGALFINLGRLCACVVVPFLPQAIVRFPDPFRPLKAGQTFRRLKATRGTARPRSDRGRQRRT